MLGITVCLLTILPSSQSRGEKYVAVDFIHAGYLFKDQIPIHATKYASKISHYDMLNVIYKLSELKIKGKKGNIRFVFS